MKMKFINICLFTAGCLFVTGCNDDNEIFFEDLTGNRANDHKVNELRFSNNFVEKRSSSFLKALRNQDILLTEWWSMHQPNRVNYKFHDFFKSGS